MPMRASSGVPIRRPLGLALDRLVRKADRTGEQVGPPQPQAGLVASAPPLGPQRELVRLGRRRVVPEDLDAVAVQGAGERDGQVDHLPR